MNIFDLNHSVTENSIVVWLGYAKKLERLSNELYACARKLASHDESQTIPSSRNILFA
jgi:hypothetical protein